MSVVTIRHQTTQEASNGHTDNGVVNVNGVVNGNGVKPFDADDVVVVFWSSGTTGRPKGIMHAAGYLVSSFRGSGPNLALK